MKNLSFDDGYKEFMINGNPSRVVRFNPSDMAILGRLKNAMAKISEAQINLEDIEMYPDGTPVDDSDRAATVVSQMSEFIIAQINYIFNSDIGDIVFAGQSPMSMVGGMPLYERFIEAVIPEIEAAVKAEKEKSVERISKYTSQVADK